ncbi:MAG: putative LPS assembly protein LptD [Flavobacteriales bacterium]
MIIQHSIAGAQTVPADSTGAPVSNNVATPDSIIDSSDFGIDEEVVYFGKDSTVMDLVNEKVYLYGLDSYVKYGDLEVKAARIEFSFEDYTAFAKGVSDSTGKFIGRPVFKDGENQFEEDSLAYNFKSKKGLSYGARTQEGDAYLLAGISKKQENDWINIGNGKLTTCDKPNPHYYFNLKRAIVVPNEKVVSGPFYLKFRKIPTPLALPFGFFPNKKESSHGILLPGYGNGQERGYFLQNLGYYIPLGQKWETSFLFDVYTRGSWVARNLTSYKKNYKYSGRFNVSRTVSKFGLPELSSYRQQKTFNVQWDHTQDAKARPNSRFSANVNMGSSQNFTNNLNSSQTDFLSSTFQSSIQYNKNWAGTPFSMGVSARHSQNTQSRIVSATLPSVALTMSRVNIFKSVFKRNPIGLTANGTLENVVSEHEREFRLNNLDYLNRNSKNGARYSAALSTSYKLPKGITFNPSLNADWLWTFKYLNKSIIDGNVVQTDTLNGFRQNLTWNAAGSFNFRVYGTFIRKNPDAKIKAIRHLIQPTIGVSYAPYALVQTNGFYGNNGEFLGYSQWDVARFVPSNSIQQGNINFSMTQNVEAKVRDKAQTKIAYKKVKIIESFRSSLSYNMMADSLNFSNVNFSGFTTIAQNTTLNYSSTYSMYDFNSKGQNIDKYVWEDGGSWLRMTGTNFALSTRLKSKQKIGAQRADGMSKDEEDFVNANKNKLIDWSVPWTLNLNYNLRFSKVFNSTIENFETKLIQAATFSGSFRLFDKVAINFDSGYEFETKKITTTTIGATVDLHCWEFSSTWVPFGTRKSYMFQLNIKSPLLKDLKLQKRGNYGDLLY